MSERVFSRERELDRTRDDAAAGEPPYLVIAAMWSGQADPAAASGEVTELLQGLQLADKPRGASVAIAQATTELDGFAASLHRFQLASVLDPDRRPDRG
jgi:hypothetical protein